jgi:hypothetical protein
MHRLWAATTIASLIVALTSAGVLTWVLVDPHYWFPGAYAQKGARGNPGPRGPIGRRGPPGPVGPNAASAIDDLSSQVDDLSSRLDDAETGTGDQAAMSLDDVANTVQGMCDGLLIEGGAFEDIYNSGC